MKPIYAKFVSCLLTDEKQQEKFLADKNDCSFPPS